jgi:hypothetical protein
MRLAFWDVGGPASLERIHPVAFPKTLRGHRKPKSAIGSLCANFAEAAFSTFSTQSAQSRHGTMSDLSPLCAPNRTSISRDHTACCKNDYGTRNSNGEMADR